VQQIQIKEKKLSKYDAFQVSAPFTRPSKLSPDTTREYVQISCPHCAQQFGETTAEAISKMKSTHCAKHLLECPVFKTVVKSHTKSVAELKEQMAAMKQTMTSDKEYSVDTIKDSEVNGEMRSESKQQKVRVLIGKGEGSKKRGPIEEQSNLYKKQKKIKTDSAISKTVILVASKFIVTESVTPIPAPIAYSEIASVSDKPPKTCPVDLDLYIK